MKESNSCWSSDRANDSACEPSDCFSGPSAPANSCPLPSPCTILDGTSQVVVTPLSICNDSGLNDTFFHPPFPFGPGSRDGNWIGGCSGSAGLVGEAVGALGGVDGAV